MDIQQIVPPEIAVLIRDETPKTEDPFVPTDVPNGEVLSTSSELRDS